MKLSQRTWIVSLLCFVSGSLSASTSAYDMLLKRYERQIKQQERRLERLRSSLAEKERDAQRWQKKSEEAKVLWNQAGANTEKARVAVEGARELVKRARTLADAAEWSATEQMLLASSSDGQLTRWVREIYAQKILPKSQPAVTVHDRLPEYFVKSLTGVSEGAHKEAESAAHQEAKLRTEEMRWQSEEQSKTAELDKLRDRQQSLWSRWQEALRKRNALEEEKAQVEQSEKALQVMLQELRNHRDHTLAARQGMGARTQELASLRGTLPWPVLGQVTQSFGRQYSKELNQLLVSNGIKIEAAPGQTVRVIQPGKVLFASVFRQYGQLIIVQHKSGLTSVYGGLGQTQVKEGDMLAALDAVGSIGDQGSFYFELRRDEEPVDPLVYLTPKRASDISLRRKFQ